jgi:hypothetical protein
MTQAKSRVLIEGQPVLSQADLFTVAGCGFMVGPEKQPCFTAEWLIPCRRVLIEGKSAVSQNSAGICYSAEKRWLGSPIVVSTQSRVKGL